MAHRTADLPLIIQGGMGVAISDWRLARAVSSRGQLGVVSGTGLVPLLIARLVQGDPGGHVRRALRAFPCGDTARRILERYPASEDVRPVQPRLPLWTPDPPRELEELGAVAAFVEVWLAREGHGGAVGINLLEKIQMPLMATLYGAMLAGVDVVIVGAGIPTQVPAILDTFCRHLPARYRLDLHGTGDDRELTIEFDPRRVFPGIAEHVGSLRRPRFLPIVASVVLAKAMLRRAPGGVQGFVVEGPVAGGHNAPPRGSLTLDEQGEPVYGPRDEVDLAAMARLGLPFWLAGGYDTAEALRRALDAGAAGIQMGTAFAFCEESGMDPRIRRQVLEAVLAGTIRVRTDPVVSPTGFPFKVAEVAGTLSESGVHSVRQRVCDLGMLRQAHRLPDGRFVWRCSAEPVETFVAKGGRREDAEPAVCLCNALAATAGFPQVRPGGILEPAIVTSGDGLPRLTRFLQDGRTTYTVQDVLDAILQESSWPVAPTASRRRTPVPPAAESLQNPGSAASSSAPGSPPSPFRPRTRSTAASSTE